MILNSALINCGLKTASHVCGKLLLKMNCFMFFLLNKSSLIKVNTPFGNTESFTFENIIKQGSTYNGPILCRLSSGQYCDTKNSFSYMHW